MIWFLVILSVVSILALVFSGRKERPPSHASRTERRMLIDAFSQKQGMVQEHQDALVTLLKNPDTSSPLTLEIQHHQAIVRIDLSGWDLAGASARFGRAGDRFVFTEIAGDRARVLSLLGTDVREMLDRLWVALDKVSEGALRHTFEFPGAAGILAYLEDEELVIEASVGRHAPVRLDKWLERLMAVVGRWLHRVGMETSRSAMARLRHIATDPRQRDDAPAIWFHLLYGDASDEEEAQAFVAETPPEDPIGRGIWMLYGASPAHDEHWASLEMTNAMALALRLTAVGALMNTSRDGALAQIVTPLTQAVAREPLALVRALGLLHRPTMPHDLYVALIGDVFQKDIGRTWEDLDEVVAVAYAIEPTAPMRPVSALVHDGFVRVVGGMMTGEIPCGTDELANMMLVVSKQRYAKELYPALQEGTATMDIPLTSLLVACMHAPTERGQRQWWSDRIEHLVRHQPASAWPDELWVLLEEHAPSRLAEAITETITRHGDRAAFERALTWLKTHDGEHHPRRANFEAIVTALQPEGFAQAGQLSEIATGGIQGGELTRADHAGGLEIAESSSD